MSFPWLPASLVERIGWLLVHSLWEFALIALALVIDLRMMRRKSANVRYTASLFALVGVMIAPVITWRFLPTPDSQQELARSEPAVGEFRRNDEFDLPARKIETARAPSDSSATPTAPVESNQTSASTARELVEVKTSWKAAFEAVISPWLRPLFTAWCIGVFLFALRPAWSWFMLRRLRRVGVASVSESLVAAFDTIARRMSVGRSARLMQSTLVTVPIVVGYLRPIVLLPLCVVNGLSLKEVESILAHELAHIRRHDYLVNLLQTVLETICFYHPAVWWISSRVRQEREHCCDELGAQIVGNRAAYGRALLALDELRGTAPILSMGANGGSLLERIRRLSISNANRQAAGPGGLMVAALSIILVCSIAIWSASFAAGAPEKSAETSAMTPNAEPFIDDPHARELAVKAHTNAAAVDSLPRILIHAKAGTRNWRVMPNASPDALQNLLRGLDETVPDEDWHRYNPFFGWDKNHFVQGHDSPHAYSPEQWAGKDPADNPPSTWFTWGTRELAGERIQKGDEPVLHALRADATTMGRELRLMFQYLDFTDHKFWWGENPRLWKQIHPLPASVVPYRQLPDEDFDGEPCYVVESRVRPERLWISQKSGLVRGHLRYSYKVPQGLLYGSKVVQEIFGRSFASPQEYDEWFQTKFESLPAETQQRFWLAYHDSIDQATFVPKVLVRFRDYREIAPGVWWPFQEDRVNGATGKDGFECQLSRSTIDAVRTDLDLTDMVQSAMPQEGEKVIDRRFGIGIEYKYDPSRAPAEVLRFVDAEYQKRLKDADSRKRFSDSFASKVGKPAPTLPDETWVGGGKPDVQGKPYLVHFWATWSEPSKKELPILKQLADSGAIVVGMHHGGTPPDEVAKAVKDLGLGYPTYVPAVDWEHGIWRTLGGYPALLFPYSILVGADGNVAAHGSLLDKDSKLLEQFSELRSAKSTSSNSKTKSSDAANLAATNERVEMVCVNDLGAPVAGAEVHLFQLRRGNENRFEQFGPFTTDEQGRAVCSEARFQDDAGHYDRWFYARVPGRLVGVLRSAKWKHHESFHANNKIELHPSRTIEGHVTVPAGFDPTRVTVRVHMMDILSSREPLAYHSWTREASFQGLDSSLAEIFERRPDKDGRIQFSDVPKRGSLYLLTKAEGLGEAQWRNDNYAFDQPIELKLEPEGSIFGQVLAPDGKPAAKMKVSAQLSDRGAKKFVHLSTFSSVTNDDGRFAIHGLPGCEYVLSVDDAAEQYTFRPLEGRMIEPGQKEEARLSMETGVVVNGHVLDQNGQPVEGASFSALTNTLHGSVLSHDMVDANGRYEFRLPEGDARLYFDALPSGFIYPVPQTVKELDIQKGEPVIDNLDFTLQRERKNDKSVGRQR